MLNLRYFGFAVILAPLMVTSSCTLHLITVSPSSLNFSPEVVGTTSAVQTIEVRNAGTVAENIFGVISSGLYSQTNNCPASLPAKATCTINVQFKPTAVGQINGAVQVAASVTPRPPLVSLSGAGITPVTFSPASLFFGTVAVGATSAAQSLALTNNQSTAIAISSVSTSADFSQANNCPASLGPGASCEISVMFHPTVSRPVSGVLNVATSALPGTQPLGLSGRGSGPVASHVAFSPANLSFGKQEAGRTSTTKNVTLTNTSATTSLTILGLSASSNYNAGGTCAGKMIPPGSSCVISVTFHPTSNFAPVGYPGAVTIVDSDGTSPQVVGLSGTGVAPITASPGSINFGTILAGHSSPARTVTLTNYHATAETPSIVTSLEYNLNNNGCSSPVPAAGQCSFQIAFSPHFFGSINGATTISASSGGFLSPQVVSLSGCSSNSILSPPNLGFGNEPVGMTSAPLMATLYAQNPISISSISITGKNAGDFSTGNNCGSDLGGTQSCTIVVLFTPTATGTRSGILSVTDSGGCSPQQVNLTGTGT